MVDVAHDGDYRRAWRQVLRLILNVQFDLLYRRMDDSAAALALFNLKFKSVSCANSLGNRFLNRLVDRGEYAQLHQVSDDLERLLFQMLGQFTNHNRRFDRDDLGIRWEIDFRSGRLGFTGRFTCR